MLEELAISASGPESREARAVLAAEFPSVFVRFDVDGPPHLRASDWDRADFDTWAFDCAIDALAGDAFTLRIVDDCGVRQRPVAALPSSERSGSADARAATSRRRTPQSFALEVMNRCQRHVGRRNRHSQGALFTRVLRKHRALHDLDKPLVRADYNHALDVWQWVLRLEPDATISLQFAALFHDVERLVSEAEARVEHLAADYQQFKDAHARAGASMTEAILADCGVSASVRAEVAQLVTAHEHERGLLGDADALSFFSLNSSGYADYFGPEQTRKKVAWTWNRMNDRARSRTTTIRLRPDVRSMLDEVD